MKNTPQTRLVAESLASLGHATNAQLLDAVRPALPELTISSVHRITSRLVAQGAAGFAPVREDVLVLDARPEPHSHFVCRDCWRVKDIELPEQMTHAIAGQLPGDIISNCLTVFGSCKNCPSAQLTQGES